MTEQSLKVVAEGHCMAKNFGISVAQLKVVLKRFLDGMTLAYGPSIRGPAER
jgi:hypothetical protein